MEKETNVNTITSKVIAIILDLPWVAILTETWKHIRKRLQGMASEGIYEVLEYEMDLILHDAKGKNATYKKRQKVRYLQNSVIAYYDQAWGDGKILLDFKCSPGKPADQYRLGHKTIILVSLRKINARGDRDEFNIEWKMENNFLKNTDEWTTSIDHKTKHLKLNVIFPSTRPPQNLFVIEVNRQRYQKIDNLKKMPNGDWKVTWEKKRPRLYEDYIIRWDW